MDGKSSACVGIVVAVLLVVSPRPTTGEERQVVGAMRCLAPAPDVNVKNAGGDVDYLAALNRAYSQGVTPENNAVVPLVRAFGPTAIDEEHREATYKALGIDALPEGGDYFVTFDDFVQELAEQEYKVWLAKQKEALPAGALTESEYTGWEVLSIRSRIKDRLHAETRWPWRSEDSPLVAAWLKRNEPHLASFAEASRRSRWFAPFAGMRTPDRTWLYFQFWSLVDRRLAREVILALSMRTRLHLGEGRPDAACRDAVAAMRLAEAQTRARLFDDLYDASGAHIASLSAMESVLEEAALTSDRARQMLAELGDESDLPTLADMIGPAEELSLVATFPHLARHGLSSTWRDTEDSTAFERTVLSRGEAAILHLFVDWSEAAAMAEDYRHGLNAAVARKSYAERKAAIEKLIPPGDGSFFDGPRRETLEFLEQLGPALFDPATRRRLVTRRIARHAIEDHVCDIWDHLLLGIYEDVLWSRRAGRIGLALAAYRADRGAFPAKLDDLAPNYLPAVPRDPHTNRALHYRREGGGYLLYGLGANGKDDGARSFWEKGKCKSKEPPKDADDIVLRVSGVAYPLKK